MAEAHNDPNPLPAHLTRRLAGNGGSVGSGEIPARESPRRQGMVMSLEQMREETNAKWTDYISATRAFSADLRQMLEKLDRWLGV